MGKHRIRTTRPSKFDAERFATNGQIAEAAAFAKMAHGFNQLTYWQRQPIMTKALGSTSNGGGTVSNLYPAAFRTGHTTTTLDVFCGLNWNGVAGTTEISLTATVRPLGGGTAVDSGTFVAPITNAAGSSTRPEDVRYGHIRLEGLTAKTAYQLELAPSSLAKVVCLAATQQFGIIYADDTVSGVVNPTSLVVGGDIDDGELTDLVTAANSLWKYNGTPILMWSCDYDQAAGATGVPRTTSTSYANIFASGVTIGVETQYRTTRSRGGTFPVEVSVCYERVTASAPSADGSLRLTDGTTNIDVTLTGNGGVDTWTSTTGSWPAQASSTGWEIQARAADDGFGTDHFDIYGVYVWPYEA